MLPTDGVWRVIVIPAYLTMLVSAILGTTLQITQWVPHVVLIPIAATFYLGPFLAFDWVVDRCRRRRDTVSA